MKYFLICCIVVLAAATHCCTAQTRTIDSLTQIISKSKQDTNEVKALSSLSKEFENIGRYDTALIIANQTLALAKKLQWKNGIAKAYNAIGSINMTFGNYSRSIKEFFNSLKVWEETGNKKKMAETYNNIGAIYSFIGDNDEAIKQWQAVLKLREETGDKEDMITTYFNLATVYMDRKNYSQAMAYYTSSLKIAQEINSPPDISSCYHNIALLYQNQSNYPEALKYYALTLKIAEQLDNKDDIALVYNNIGEIYISQKNYDVALKNHLLALKIRESIDDKEGLIMTYTNLADIYSATGKMKESKEWLSKSLNMAKELGIKDEIKDAYQNLSKIDSALLNYKEAYNDYKMYVLYRDSILNEENTKKITQTQMQYEFDKKQTADSIKVGQERVLNGIKFEQEKQQRYFLYGGLLLVALFAGFMFNRFKVTQKQKHIIEIKEKETQEKNVLISQQKEEVEHQKHLVLEKQKEILDSITYAQRLQQAILPPREFIAAHLQDSFLLYKPKDIVAGDFYWAESIGDLFFIAAADSTGHGVPGAMVSVVCSNALNRAVNEFGLTDTGKILDKTRELVIETFEKSNAEVKDGMDISLLCIDKKNQHVFWSGANNPLWYIQDGVLTKIKANKQPVGKTYEPAPFTTHQIEYKTGTMFYLFTDGLADQFGGAAGKKFKYTQFEELLVAVANDSLSAQQEVIDRRFEQWKGELEQIDDVCVIGIRI